MFYLFHQIAEGGKTVYYGITPYEKNNALRDAGFKWSGSAWSTETLSCAVSFARNAVRHIIIAEDTLWFFLKEGKITSETFNTLLERTKTANIDRKTQAAINAATMSDEVITAIHDALRKMAANCDGATADDGAGFNRNDVEYGHSLAAKDKLKPTDAGYGKLILYKYRGQIGDGLYYIIFPDVYMREHKAAHDKLQKKAEKAAPKLHKAGSFCEWEGCEPCRTARAGLSGLNDQLASAGLPTIEIDDTLPTDVMVAVKANQNVSTRIEPRGYTLPVPADLDIVNHPTRVVQVEMPDEADDAPVDKAEVKRLAMSLIDCHPGDFDTTVELLRDLRKIDAPKKVKKKDSFIGKALSGAGYEVSE